ncbi:MAG: aldehyde dehydrogenase family protein, partial [Myxococcales bacterium]
MRSVFATGRTRPRAWRITQLDSIVRFCEERESEIADAIEADLGRGRVEAWMTEVASSRMEAVHTRKHLRRWMRSRPKPLPLNQMPAVAMVQPEPLGTVLVIGPWNYPVYLILGPLVAAVAAGNTVVLKPSELAPATARLLAELLPQYVDPEAIRVVEGDGAVTQELLAQGFDHALFTGGTEIGRKIMAGAAPHLTPVTLELGGKSPVVVDETADIEIAARRIAWTKLMNSGQTCIAPDHLFAHSSIRDDLVRRIGQAMSEFRAEEQGGQPIVNERQFRRLSDALDRTDGQVVRGGHADSATQSIEPAIVVDPSPVEPLMQEEIFGPVLPVIGFDSLDEVISRINAGEKPLAAYLFTTSRDARRRFIAEVPAGGIVVNHLMMHVLVPGLPFGGVGASGMGAYH